MRRIIIAIITLLVSSQFLNAQDWEWNFGLHIPQDKLPSSRKAPENMERKPWEDSECILRSTGTDGEYIIDSGWGLISGEDAVSMPLFDSDCDMTGWYNATVPGTVLTTLVDQNVYPDPYIGLNNMQIPDTLCRMDWWYRVVFDSPVKAKGNPYLLFNGINYKAVVWLNGHKLGYISGAFTRGQFEVGDYIQSKDNVLLVHILPVNNPGIPHEQIIEDQGPNGGLLCLDGPTFIATEGWDWMPAMRDRSIGIWQDVRLHYAGNVIIGDSQIVTDLPLPDTSYVDLTLKTSLKNRSRKDRKVTVKASVENISIEKLVNLKANETAEIEISHEEFAELRMAAPKLWWPNGYGDQHLYDMELAIYEGEEKSDSKKIRFGVRELSYELMVDGDGEQGMRVTYSPTDISPKRPLFDYDHRKLRQMVELNPDVRIPLLRDGVSLSSFAKAEKSDNPYIVFKVNGQKIFCRGGDWGMDDAMKRNSRERLEPYIKLHALENFNMIRNWQGQSTSEDLYDLCDEYGILVWNDFFMSTGWYSLRPHDFKLFVENAKDVVRRSVNHPSIAVWCCGNETWAPEWIEEELQKMIAAEDGTRHYHGNSRLINMTSSGPWKYIRDYTEYYRNLAYGFNTELGAPSVPAYETLLKFIPQEDLWPINDVWAYHDALVNGWVGWNEYSEDIDALGMGPCESAEEFCDRAQILNYNHHRTMFEAWNDKMWESTSGVLYWMSHPACYSLVQQTYSWDYKTFGTYYGCKKACEPVHVQWNLNDNGVSVINTTLNDIKKAKVSFEVYSVSGKRILLKETVADIQPNSETELFTMAIPKHDEDLVMVRLKLKNSRGDIVSINDYWCNDKYLTAPSGLDRLDAKGLRVRTLSAKDGVYTVLVENKGRRIIPYVYVNALYDETGASVLPAYVSDSYFNLCPGERKIVEIEIPKGIHATIKAGIAME